MVPSSLCEDPIGTWGAFYAKTFKKVIVEPSSLCEEPIASWMHFVGGVPGSPGGSREGPWRAPGALRRGSGGPRQQGKQRGEEHNKEQKNNYI